MNDNKPHSPTHSVVSRDALRSQFSQKLSLMYQAEVPQYATLLDIVARVNRDFLRQHPEIEQAFHTKGEPARLDLERHGAIRVGTAQELRAIARMFALMGMEPVGYYDLSVAGVPVHSTAFRPKEMQALAHNPLRVFTSLLRLDLIDNQDLAQRAQTILAQRQIMSESFLDLIAQGEATGGFSPEQAEAFCDGALEVFRWHTNAIVDAPTYQALHDAHRLIADVVCFKGPHINHLTPRTLDIDAAQEAMRLAGLSAKAVIEGPPRRTHPILLRQTSFQALTEAVEFLASEGGNPTPGAHTARFGEIEQRGMALTPKGRALYDRLLDQARQRSDKAQAAPSEVVSYEQALQTAFQAFPDDLDALRRERLAYFHYAVMDMPQQVRAQARVIAQEALDTALAPKQLDTKVLDGLKLIDTLVDLGAVRAEPIVYEDFLPVSAAGIFRSNLGEGGASQSELGHNPAQAQFECDLGRPVLDPFALYENQQQDSLRVCLALLG